MDHFVGHQVNGSRQYVEPSQMREVEQRVSNLEQEIRSLKESIDTLVQALQSGMQR